MPDQPTSTPTNPKGIFCSECHGVRLAVQHTRHLSNGVTVRYRQCSACGFKLITEERVSKTRKPRKTRDKAA